MKLTFVCFNALGDTCCSKCHKIIDCKKTHHRGVWFPDKPFEDNAAGRGYVYALCNLCHHEVKDEKTNMPGDVWLSIIEDEIKEALMLQKINRIKIDTSNMTNDEVFNQQMLLLTGVKTKARS